MPEGDTVRRAAAQVHQALAGRTLDLAEIRVPRFSAVDLTGHTVHAARSRGKHLFVVVGSPGGTTGCDTTGCDTTDCATTVETDRGQLVLHIHLKMEGRIRVHRAGERWRFPAHTARLVLRAGGIEVVGTELGLLRVLTPAEADRAVAHLGPDLLGSDWTPNVSAAAAVRRLEERPDRTIGEALLDQRNLAGIGTIYRAEICFLRGIDPRDPVWAVPDLPAVVDLARRLMVANADREMRVTTGDSRRGRRMWVYGRDGTPCRRCGTLVESFRLGGRSDPDEPSDSLDRIAYACPSCQPRRATLGANPTKENT